MRQQVLKAAREMGYSPNMLAQGLRGARTNAIGIIWELGGGPHPSVRMVRNIATRVQAHGCVTYVVDGLGNAEVIQRALTDFRQRRVDSVVIEVGSDLGLTDWMEERLGEFPSAVAVTTRRYSSPIDQIIRDRSAAFHAAADHLAKAGRHRPGCIGLVNGSRKIQAFVDRLKFHGITVPPEHLIDVRVPDTQEIWAPRSYEMLQSRFDHGPVPFDALICTTDEIAVAAMAWLRSRNLRVPQDVAVIGANDNEICPFTHPSLASIARRDEEVADAIEKMVFARLDNPGPPVQCLEIPMEFIPRESAG
jgi:DNA-binding LacI/PurR family transcriptional regulator